jgi:predicted GH43/DUF377 family glycosyl hydrolase
VDMRTLGLSLVIGLVMLAVLCGCGAAESAQSPPTATHVQPSATFSPPTIAPTPRATALPPTETLTPSPAATAVPPTETAAPTPEPTSTRRPTATPTRKPEVVFRLYEPQSDSILPPAGLPIFRGPYTDPGGLVYYGGQFHMFYNNLQDFPPTEITIGYATSPDGRNWMRASDSSILDPQQIPYVDNVLRAASVLVEEDGTWVLYFDTMAAEEAHLPYSVIGRATADSPAGPWKADPAPVLVPDPDGWDRYAIQRPCVLKTEDGYAMYYQAFSDKWLAPTVALATSSDGRNWVKHETPVFQGSDVTWGKHISVHYPYVVRNDGSWLLFFKGSGDRFPESIGMAVSQDGIHWQLAQNQPVFQAGQYPNWLTLFVLKVLRVDQTWYLFLELENLNGSRVNVALFEGALIPGKNIAPLAPEPSPTP